MKATSNAAMRMFLPTALSKNNYFRGMPGLGVSLS